MSASQSFWCSDKVTEESVQTSLQMLSSKILTLNIQKVIGNKLRRRLKSDRSLGSHYSQNTEDDEKKGNGPASIPKGKKSKQQQFPVVGGSGNGKDAAAATSQQEINYKAEQNGSLIGKKIMNGVSNNNFNSELLINSQNAGTNEKQLLQ